MIRPRTPRREQLGEFLATRRRAASRSALGLPSAPRRGDLGLSREEVAALAGVSASWFTWLEQGRDIGVSRQVLGAVARVLQLSAAEMDYVVHLAGPDDETVAEEPERLPSHLQRLVDALDFPAFVVASDWAIVGWNAPYAGLYEPIATLAPADRNLLWLVYTDPQLRRMLPDWDQESRRFLAEFRAESGVRLGSHRHRALVARLQEASDDFRIHWAEHAVERFSSRRRVFEHPVQGRRVFEHHSLVPSDAPGLSIVLYVPV
ncbi:helix-turn-helix transcriptional regulator [uncultured Microbacterium sp.]|uniref:helix-turn-helix transcriptional regulator n=1 Tax=uncultured Microbacterium sp. TaxID=191216 RepID=UPI002600D990|nr:helix-turn-helix transcriptional regulator [uncultured Microbacterium sp.]